MGQASRTRRREPKPVDSRGESAWLAAIHFQGIVLLDVASYLFAIVTLFFVRFPDLLGWRPRERLLAAIAGGLRYSWHHRGSG